MIYFCRECVCLADSEQQKMQVKKTEKIKVVLRVMERMRMRKEYKVRIQHYLDKYLNKNEENEALLSLIL